MDLRVALAAVGAGLGWIGIELEFRSMIEMCNYHLAPSSHPVSFT